MMLMVVSGLLFGGTAMAQSSDAPPTPVRGLQVTVYSGTSAGLKWRRASDDRGVRGYEVYREGTLVGEFDALSYIVTDLVPGSLNNFAVVSVDNAGQRANASTGIAFETPGGQVSVTPPMTPALRAAVYSSTAAGLAWTRPTDTSTVAQRVARYELRRDGVLVSTTRDASYIDTMLQGGRTYAYELVAINSLGGRSEPARVAVTTPGTGTGDGGSGSGGDPAVAAPTGLRSVVYSATAGAIAWNRAATTGLRYEVFRDGASLGVVDATSYVDKDLTGGRDYRYEVVTIDRQGRRSAPAGVTLRTTGSGSTDPGPTTPPPAGDTNPQNLRARVYSSTSAGLIWDRPATGTGSYFELRRDDTIIAVGSLLTWVDDSLEGGRTYVYELTRRTASGNRLSRITVTTPANPADVLPPPARLSSSTDAAFRATLAWEASRTPDVVYEVFRGYMSAADGTPLTTTESTSYTVDDPVTGFGEFYEVVAVDARGRRSRPSVIVVPGPDFD